MQPVALADGDPRWVFPDLDDAAPVMAALREADLVVRDLAGRFGVRPSWTGSGLEYHTFPATQRADGRLASHRPSLFGCVELAEVSFAVELESWVQVTPDLVGTGPPWEVHAQVTRRCDGRGRFDCGMHIIEERDTTDLGSPVAAVRAVLAAAVWLRQRAVAEPVEGWRQRDPVAGHA